MAHWVNRHYLTKWIDTVSFQWKPNIMSLLFEKWSCFLDVPKCITIYRHLKNTNSTFFPCMAIHKLCYAFALEQSLQTWNNGNITKNLARNLFCYLICSISTYMTFHTFRFKFILIIIYNMVIGACMNCFIMNSNLVHDGR